MATKKKAVKKAARKKVKLKVPLAGGSKNKKAAQEMVDKLARMKTVLAVYIERIEGGYRTCVQAVHVDPALATTITRTRHGEPVGVMLHSALVKARQAFEEELARGAR